MKFTAPPPVLRRSGGNDLSAELITDGIIKLMPNRLTIAKKATFQYGVLDRAAKQRRAEKEEKEPAHDDEVRLSAIRETPVNGSEGHD